MRMVKLYWLTSLLAILSLILVTRAVQIKKDTEIINAQIAAKEVTSAAPGKKLAAAKKSDAEAITIKQLTEALAAKHHLPIYVKLGKAEMTLSPVQGQETAKDPTAATDGTEKEIAAKKNLILRDYDSILDFWSSMSALPYAMTFKDLCIGSDCPEGFSATISLH